MATTGAVPPPGPGPWSPEPPGLSVAARDGVITLSGLVEGPGEQRAAERVAGRLGELLGWPVELRIRVGGPERT